MSGILTSSLVALSLVSQAPVWSERPLVPHAAHDAQRRIPQDAFDHYTPRQTQYWDTTNSRMVYIETHWGGRVVQWRDSRGQSGMEFRNIGINDPVWTGEQVDEDW
jgi:hypothetical protein